MATKGFIRAAAAPACAVALATLTPEPVTAAASCATATLDERIAGFERAAEDFGVEYRFKVVRHNGNLTNIYLIVAGNTGFEAVQIIFIDGCQLPARGPRLDPENTARTHFQKSVAALFAEEI